MSMDCSDQHQTPTSNTNVKHNLDRAGPGLHHAERDAYTQGAGLTCEEAGAEPAGASGSVRMRAMLLFRMMNLGSSLLMVTSSVPSRMLTTTPMMPALVMTLSFFLRALTIA